MSRRRPPMVFRTAAEKFERMAASDAAAADRHEVRPRFQGGCWQPVCSCGWTGEFVKTPNVNLKCGRG